MYFAVVLFISLFIVPKLYFHHILTFLGFVKALNSSPLSVLLLVAIVTTLNIKCQIILLGWGVSWCDCVCASLSTHALFFFHKWVTLNFHC
jgi:hypothetical protein